MAVFVEMFKMVATRPQVRPTALIGSVLESSDPGASNGGPNLQIRYFGADMAAFEVAGWPRNSRFEGQIRDSESPSDFKSRHVGPKVSYLQV